jgi:ATP-dependent Clp protease adaptor protein ClpS
MKVKMSGKSKPEIESKPGSRQGSGGVSYLVLHNDDVHTFDYVINCLVEVCKHDVVQAEQCTYLVHFKGSCDIMKGRYSELLPFRQAMAARDLKVTIE